jgi:hypothetical protein
MSKKAPKAPKRRPAKGIPFVALVGSPGWERNARLALESPRTDPALRAQLERYLANPFRAAAQDQEARDRAYNDLLDGRVKVGTDNLARHAQQQSSKWDAEALKAVEAWRNDPVRCGRLSGLSQADVIQRYLKQRPPRRQGNRLRAMLKDGRIK